MKIRTLIVDDEAPARRRLHKLLSNTSTCEIVGEAENGQEAITLIARHQPDLLLLDIQLKDMTGFDVLKKTAASFDGVVIFITAYDEYAIQAFETKAVDYLLKPFKNTRFQESLQHALDTIERGQKPSIDDLLAFFNKKSQPEEILKISEGKVLHHVNAEELIFIQAEGYYCHFHLGAKKKMIRISLKQVAIYLPENFVRINRSVIINLKKISSTKKLKKSVQVCMQSNDEFTAFHHLELLH